MERKAGGKAWQSVVAVMHDFFNINCGEGGKWIGREMIDFGAHQQGHLAWKDVCLRALLPIKKC